LGPDWSSSGRYRIHNHAVPIVQSYQRARYRTPLDWAQPALGWTIRQYAAPPVEQFYNYVLTMEDETGKSMIAFTTVHVEDELLVQCGDGFRQTFGELRLVLDEVKALESFYMEVSMDTHGRELRVDLTVLDAHHKDAPEQARSASVSCGSVPKDFLDEFHRVAYGGFYTVGIDGYVGDTAIIDDVRANLEVDDDYDEDDDDDMCNDHYLLHTVDCKSHIYSDITDATTTTTP